jgi:hypothetical protein
MKEAEKLLILKRDLQLRTSSNDEYLSFLLSGAKKLMQQEGITLIEGDTNCDMVQIQYAAYLFRRRGGEETSMPRFLRYELNNLLFSQKGRIDT